MRNNSLHLSIALFALLGAGCDRDAAPPPGYQGVVELEERVVSFETAGRVDDVAVEEGDEVTAGQTLATLDDALAVLTREARAREVAVAVADLDLLEAGSRREDVSAAMADVRAAKAAEALADKALQRMKALVDARVSPQAELDRAEADAARASAQRQALEQRLAALSRGSRPEELDRARAQVDASRSSVALEDERLAKHRLVSIDAGRVIDVHVKTGELAAAGTAAVTLADTRHPQIDVFVPQGETDGIRVGSGAVVRVDAGGRTFSGRVEHVGTRTEFTPRFLFSERERPNLVIRVRVRVDDPDEQLHAGVPAFVEIGR